MRRLSKQALETRDNLSYPIWAAQASDRMRRTPGFNQWFSGSTVADSQGIAIPVYHGTTAFFSEFRTDTSDVTGETGVFFASDLESARGWAMAYGEYSGRVIAAHLRILNPYLVTDRQWAAREGLTPVQAKEQGFDGYVVAHHRSLEELRSFGDTTPPPGFRLKANYVAFEVDQIAVLGSMEAGLNRNPMSPAVVVRENFGKKPESSFSM